MSDPRLNYRPDIDGLRAIAVLSVVVFHIDPHWLAGGFLGVDIFFVISGFLITRIIVTEGHAQKFSIASFYNRRMKRIFPAMLAVVMATLLVGQYVLLPADYNELSNSALATVLSVANIYFTYFSDSSYFATDSALRPLLHMWSLGVEEQFYVFWPICAVFLFRRFDGVKLNIILITLVLASFILAEYLSPRAPLFSYYMLPTRAGELLLGALSFSLVRGGSRVLPDLAREAATIVAAIALGASFYLINEHMPFPGIVALVPTLAVVVLLVVGGQRGTLIGRFLGIRPLVAIGLISYSMYLWHWPVLAFAKYAHGSLSLNYKLAAFVVIVALSVLSYWLVERPFRRNDLEIKRTFLGYLVAPTVIIALLGAGIAMTNGYGFSLLGDYAQRMAAVADRVPAAREARVCQRPQLTASDVRDPACATSSIPNVLLWGDSNAAHFVGTLNEIGEAVGFDLRNAAHSSCPPLLDAPERFVTAGRREACARSAEVVHRELSQYAGLILAANWPAYVRRDANFPDALSATLRELVESGHVVYVLGRIPRFDTVDAECENKSVKLPFINCSGRDVTTRADADLANAVIRQAASESGAHYVDFSDVFCDGDICTPYLGGVNLYFDPVHLSGDGSDILGQVSSETPEYLAAFAPLAALPERSVQSRPSRFENMEILSVEDLSDRALWRQFGADLADDVEGLLFSDNHGERYGRVEYNPDNGRGIWLPAGETAVLEVTFSTEAGARPLVRLRLSPALGGETSDNRVDLNYLIFPDAAYVDIRPQGAITDYELVPLSDGRLRFRASVPATDTDRYVRPIVYPAAVGPDRSLDPSMIGATHIFQISMARTGVSQD